MKKKEVKNKYGKQNETELSKVDRTLSKVDRT